jgi:branched-subunit amino acid aminotransferase/4-amino-4-deoxychorismate lyase
MPVNLRDVPFMRAAFATNTTIGIRPITAIDGVSLPGDAEIFQLLRKSYEEIPAERI